MKLKTFRLGGVHPEEDKLTSNCPTQVAPLPKQAIFPLSQHIGAPAKPVVSKGDKVRHPFICERHCLENRYRC